MMLGGAIHGKGGGNLLRTMCPRSNEGRRRRTLNCVWGVGKVRGSNLVVGPVEWAKEARPDSALGP